MYDAVIALSEIAEDANREAQDMLWRYRRKPNFSSHVSAIGIVERRAQKRAAAKDSLLTDFYGMTRLRLSMADLNDVWHATDLFRRAMANARRFRPIFVGRFSFPTAHEAAIAMGEELLRVWDSVGGDFAAKHAPDRLEATNDGRDANLALETSYRLWRRLRRLRREFPADLYGLLQLELQAALREVGIEDTPMSCGRHNESPKRSSQCGDGEAKLIAALNRHHQYANGSCLNLQPIILRRLARAAEVSASTASEFFKSRFRGYDRYCRACADKQTLITAMKLLNNEFSPEMLFGRNPPGECRDNDD